MKSTNYEDANEIILICYCPLQILELCTHTIKPLSDFESTILVHEQRKSVGPRLCCLYGRVKSGFYADSWTSLSPFLNANLCPCKGYQGHQELVGI